MNNSLSNFNILDKNNIKFAKNDKFKLINKTNNLYSFLK